jgi:hypothetical protein
MSEIATNWNYSLFDRTAVMRIEQRQLLMAMHGVCCVVDIEGDGPPPSQGQAWAGNVTLDKPTPYM